MTNPQNRTSISATGSFVIVLAAWGIVVAGCASWIGTDDSLVTELRQAGRQPESGAYPDFVENPSAVTNVDLGGQSRESLTPPFPARLDFQLELPAAAFLEFSPALIMAQDVRRARVEFRVLVTGRGDAEEVYSEILRADVANRWHDREIDLSRWAGQDVLLTVETRSVPPRESPLWAERIQTAWGSPVLGSRPAKVAVARGTVITRETLDWLTGQLEASGVTPDRQATTYGFAINLLVGGLLALGIRELFKRFARPTSGRDAFANMLPLFTVATITVISVVQYSPALALGLVGALSVIRFRAAIAGAEELAYLLLCVGLGIAVGANHVALAVATVLVVSPFIALREWLAKRSHDPSRLILTIATDTAGFAGSDGRNVIDLIRDSTREMLVERFDREPESIFFRARIAVDSQEQLVKLLTTLRPRVAECQISSREPELP